VRACPHGPLVRVSSFVANGSAFNTDWGAVMAASVVMTLPIALLFLSMQRLFIGGLTAGATKG
jgi:ABC-type glycerol-3-phosphate transport system permease component